MFGDRKNEENYYYVHKDMLKEGIFIERTHTVRGKGKEFAALTVIRASEFRIRKFELYIEKSLNLLQEQILIKSIVDIYNKGGSVERFEEFVEHLADNSTSYSIIDDQGNDVEKMIGEYEDLIGFFQLYYPRE